MTDESLEVLVVRLEGHLVGLPAEQLGRITAAAGGAGSVWVEVRTGAGMRRIRVDGLEGMTLLSLGQIRRLPPLIQAQKSCGNLWGLAVLDDRIVCLVDPGDLSPDASGGFLQRHAEGPPTREDVTAEPPVRSSRKMTHNRSTSS